MQGLIRQGDVLLVPVTTIPPGIEPVGREHGRVILAHGEVTGHHHSIASPDVTLVSRREADDLHVWLSVTAPEPVELEHPEHATLLVPPGLWEVRRQREYSPAAARQVMD
jgi:hypothetical protein